MQVPPCPPGCRESRFESTFTATPEALFAFHASDDALARLAPPYPPSRIVDRVGGLETGARVVIELRPLPFIKLRWVAEHVDYEAGRGFADHQVSGPFAFWRHYHLIESAPEGSRLVDIVHWRPRPAWLAPLVFPVVAGRLRALFAFRHATTRAALEAP